MPDTIGSLARRAAVAACLVLTFAAHTAAQKPLVEAPTTAEFLSRFDFHLAAAGLSTNDDRFSWDTHWGGDFDLVDYVYGRMSFLADYQAILGRERRLFDPNQGNYTLAVAGSLRLRGTEFTGVLHHVSRHLADRAKEPAVAMNALLVRVMRQVDVRGNTLAVRLEGGPVIARAYVDYRWMTVGEATFRRAVSPHLGVYGRAYTDVYGVHREVYNRPTQSGGRIETGLRIGGKGGALELFGGYERVVDANQLDLLPGRWGFAGFRLVN